MLSSRPLPLLVMLASLLAALALAPVADAASTRRSATSSKERAVAATQALKKVRSPYRYGATGPRSFDCSGLVVYAYKRAGHAFKARTSQQLFRTGARIRRTALRRGDLVWTWDRGLGHVGIYVGRGRYVHAPGTGRRVQVAPLPNGRGFIGAMRP